MHIGATGGTLGSVVVESGTYRPGGSRAASPARCAGCGCRPWSGRSQSTREVQSAPGLQTHKPAARGFAAKGRSAQAEPERATRRRAFRGSNQRSDGRRKLEMTPLHVLDHGLQVRVTGIFCDYRPPPGQRLSLACDELRNPVRGPDWPAVRKLGEASLEDVPGPPTISVIGCANRGNARCAADCEPPSGGPPSTGPRIMRMAWAVRPASHAA
jgi:hypothetical protein